MFPWASCKHQMSTGQLPRVWHLLKVSWPDTFWSLFEVYSCSMLIYTIRQTWSYYTWHTPPPTGAEWKVRTSVCLLNTEVTFLGWSFHHRWLNIRSSLKNDFFVLRNKFCPELGGYSFNKLLYINVFIPATLAKVRSPDHLHIGMPSLPVVHRTNPGNQSE